MELGTVGDLGAEPARLVKSGSGLVSASAGQSFRIETSPNGEEILDVEVPAGKAWTVRIDVTVIEKDA